MSRTADQTFDIKASQQRTFTGEKLDWLEAVNADIRLDANAFKVAFCIAQIINRETRIAIVRDQTIADKTGISLRCVTRAKNLLRETNWLDWRRTGKANHYWKKNDPIEAVMARQIVLKKRRDENKDAIKQMLIDQPPVADLKFQDQPPVAENDRPAAAEHDQPPVADIHLQGNTFTNTPSKIRAAKTPLPDDWKPSETDRAFAEAKGIRGDRLTLEVEKFQLHFWGNGKPMLKWSAVWRAWVLRSGQFGSGGSRYDRAAPTSIF